MKANTKQFPKHQLLDFEVLEQAEKGLEKNSLHTSLLTMVAFNLTPIFRPHASSSFIWSLCPTSHKREKIQRQDSAVHQNFRVWHIFNMCDAVSQGDSILLVPQKNGDQVNIK